MGRTLLETEMLTLAEEGDVARVTLHNRPDVSPTVGAESAKQMSRFLVEKVFVPHSTYKGVIFDVRDGPAVFGPKTRGELERLFARAETAMRKIAAVVGNAAIQKLQFVNLCNTAAPTFAKVVDSLEDAQSWVLAPKE